MGKSKKQTQTPSDDKDSDSSVSSVSSVSSRTRSKQKMDLQEALDKLNEKMDGVKSDVANMNRSLTEFTEKFTTLNVQVNKNTADIAELKENAAKVDDVVLSVSSIKQYAIESYARQHSLLVNGIAFKQNENLNQIYRDISSALGYRDLPPATVTRFNQSKITRVGPDRRPIKIDFYSIPEREKFKKNYLKAPKTLTLGVLRGFEGKTDRIFIQDPLDPPTYELYKEALKLKKKNLLSEVSIRYLQVWVRRSAAEQLSCVLSIDELTKRFGTENS